MRIVLAVACLGVAGWAAAAVAADCQTALRSCQARCERAYPGAEDRAQAGCAARCGLDQAACELQRALDDTQTAIEHEVRPWIADQTSKLQRFLDGFRGRPESNPVEPTPGEPPRPAPSFRPERGTAT